MSAWEQPEGGGARVSGVARPSLAVLQMDRQIAWADFELALEHHEPEMAAEAARAWCDAWNLLLEMV